MSSRGKDYIISGLRLETTCLPPYYILSIQSMSSLRLLASAGRASLSTRLGRRGYAEAADKIKLSLVLPHAVCT